MSWIGSGDGLACAKGLCGGHNFDEMLFRVYVKEADFALAGEDYSLAETMLLKAYQKKPRLDRRWYGTMNALIGSLINCGQLSSARRLLSFVIDMARGDCGVDSTEYHDFMQFLFEVDGRLLSEDMNRRRS